MVAVGPAASSKCDTPAGNFSAFSLHRPVADFTVGSAFFTTTCAQSKSSCFTSPFIFMRSGRHCGQTEGSLWV